MGWLYTFKPQHQSVREFFDERWNNNNFVVLDLAVVKLKTAYAAIQLPDGRVVAVVCLLGYRPTEHFNFGYKDMDETQGPNEDDCPERIFKMLTPLPDVSKEDETPAHRWRARVQAKLDARKARPALKAGDRVRFENPINFGSYGQHQTFRVVKDFRTVRFVSETGLLCNIRRWKERPFEVLTA